MMGTDTFISYLCPRPYCGGVILAATGTCVLCGRSTEPPVRADSIPREHVGFRAVAVQQPTITSLEISTSSFSCRTRSHKDCSGNRSSDGKRVPCECSCHTAPAPAPASLPRWVRLRNIGGKVRAHLLKSEERRGDPPLHWEVACRRWFPMLDVQDAPGGWPRCRRCEKVEERSFTLMVKNGTVLE